MPRKTIVPSIIANSEEEMLSLLYRVKNKTAYIQLDIMDGKFVKNKSINFDFEIPKSIKGKQKIEAQLMIKNPESWIKKHASKVDMVIIHIESSKNPEKLIKLIRQKRKRVGIAMVPRTPISSVESYLKKIDQVTIMAVKPGRYGAKFIPKTLEKARALRKINNKIDIEMDGGMSPKTIKQAAKAGANKFISGSYVNLAKNPDKALKTLRNIIRGA